MRFNYDNALNLLKRSFIGSERPLWIQEVAQYFSLGQLDICDVGIGDGVSINKKLVALCEKGYDIHLSGIDPYLHANTLERKISKEIDINACKENFETYDKLKLFDIVSATHSLYYIQDKESCISKMISMLKEHGLLLLTLWSESCILYKLHCMLYGSNESVISGEIVYDLLSQHHDLIEIKVLKSETYIDISQWKTSLEMANAALVIISREMGEIDVDGKQRDILLREIRSMPDLVTRCNLMIVAKR